MLEARDIHRIYFTANKELQVLKGIDLKVEKGKFIALVGPSGAGKSTLLHILGGLDSPTKGNIFFQGHDIYKLKDAALCRIRNKKIGFIFQFYNLLSEFTVLENVLMPAWISGSGKKQGKKARISALGLLERVGLNNRIGHFPAELSGGEKQRVAIVRALINSPSVLLCDEPTGNLDSQTGDQIIALIRQINIQSDTTVVLVTHNLELASCADKVYHLRDGVLVN